MESPLQFIKSSPTGSRAAPGRRCNVGHFAEWVGSGAGHGPRMLMCWSEMLRLNCQLRLDSEVSDVTKGVKGLAKGRWLRSSRVFFIPSLQWLQIRLKVGLTLYREEGNVSLVIFCHGREAGESHVALFIGPADWVPRLGESSFIERDMGERSQQYSVSP